MSTDSWVLIQKASKKSPRLLSFHTRVFLLDVQRVEASICLSQMCHHLASCDVGEASDAVTESTKEHSIDASDDLLFECAVGCDPFTEDA